jgi:hypothetical protein
MSKTLNEKIRATINAGRELTGDVFKAVEVLTHRGIQLESNCVYSDAWTPPEEYPDVDHWYLEAKVVKSIDDYGTTIYRTDQGFVKRGPWEDKLEEIVDEMYNNIVETQRAKDRAVVVEKEQRLKKQQQEEKSHLDQTTRIFLNQQ